MEIIPGILEKEWSEIERKINLVKGFTKAIHIDIIDGKFAPNTTFLDPKPFTQYSNDLFFEVHLMVEEPTQYLKSFADAGFKRFLGHIEKMSDQVEFVAQGELLGEVGLAIDGPTDISAVKVPYEDLDTILIMSIKAGQAGQVFVTEYLKKIEILRSAQNDIMIPIEVDGGINDKTIAESRNAGANRFVANSFIFNSQNPQAQYQLLQNQVLK
jgi:ribulose-phosphate 3-epimerase